MNSLKLNFSQLDRNQVIAFCQTQISICNTQWQQDIFEFILEWFDEKTYVQAKTSGSTGEPKSIQLEKEKMNQSAKMTGEFFNFKKGNTALLCLSPQFIAGKMMIVRALIWQMELICVKPDGHPLAILNQDIDFAAMIPLQVRNSIQKPSQLNRIKTILIGGGVLDKDVEKQVQGLNSRCCASFGMTETLSHVAIKTLNGSEKSKSYKALKNISFSLDERSCLKIDAPALLSAPIVTNDMVELKSETEFEWLGRFDNVINSAGIKLFPEQIEEKIAPFINQPFFLIGTPDKHLGDKMILLIESNDKNQSLKKEIQSKIEAYLEIYQRPREIILVSEFERTLTGKIQRKATLTGITDSTKR